MCQTKAYCTPGSTQDGVVADMRQKIDAVHGQHYRPQSPPATNVDMVDNAIAIAEALEKRNRDLEAQVRSQSLSRRRVVVGLIGAVLCR